MPTHATDTENQTLGGAVKEVAEHASALARLEIELASLELKKKVTAIGVGLGLLAGAVAIGLYGIGWLFATITAGLATFLPVWLSLLIVTLVLLAIAAVLAISEGEASAVEHRPCLSRRSTRPSSPPRR